MSNQWARGHAWLSPPFKVEETFDLFISDEAAEKMVTIKDAVDYIRKHRKRNERQIGHPDQPRN